MEFGTLKQECIVCHVSPRLVGSLAFCTSGAECVVDPPPHSTVQTCVQHGQHMGCQISHIHLAIRHETHFQESTFGVGFFFALLSPHVANATGHIEAPHIVLANALEYVCVYFCLEVDAVRPPGRLDGEEPLARGEVLQHPE